MTDRETLDKAKALFTGETQGDILAREVIAIAEQRENTITCEVEHSRRIEDQLKNLHGLLEPLRDAVLYARSQRRPMGIGQASDKAPTSTTLRLGVQFGRERYADGFWIECDEIGPQDKNNPNPATRIAFELLRLAYAVADKVRT